MVLKDDRKKPVKINRLERITEEAMSTFQSVFEADQLNGGPDKKPPLVSDENPANV